MSGGFFRGTSADQDTRFSNKQAKLMKSQKFAPELEHLVDMRRVKMDVMKPWIASRVTELLGFEDEVLINFIYGLLDVKEVNGKEVQISLTGFMEKNTGKFMKELWTLLLSAQTNESGVPQQFLDAKEEETRKKQAEVDRITNEIQKKKEKERESRELEWEKSRKMDGVVETKVNDAAVEPASKGARGHSKEDKEDEKRNGVRGRTRISKSPHSGGSSSLSPRNSPSRIGNSRSDRLKSRSVSRSADTRGRSISSDRVYRSPRKQSVSPRRRRSPRFSLSPARKRSSYSRRRSRSSSGHRSPSPIPRRRLRSPYRRRSPSPIRRRRSPSPIRRRRSPSPLRRRAPSPIRRRSPTPIRRRSPSPMRRRSPSPVRRRRSPIPLRRRSPSPLRHRSQRSPSTPRQLSPSPIRHRSPLRARRRSPAPSRRRSPSPFGSSSPSPVRPRSPLSIPARRKSPAPSQDRPPSPYGSSSLSPPHQRSSAGRKRSPKDIRRLPVLSPRGRPRTLEKVSPVARRPSRSSTPPQKGAKDQKDVSRKGPAFSPSPKRSPLRSSSSYESPVRKRSGQIAYDGRKSPQKTREQKARHQSPETSREDDEIDHARSSQKRLGHSLIVSTQKDSPVKLNNKNEQSAEVSGQRSKESQSHPRKDESRKKDRETEGERSSGRGVYPETFDGQDSPILRKDSPLKDRHSPSHAGESQKFDESNHLRLNNVKDSDERHKSGTTPVLVEKVDRDDVGATFDSASEQTDKHKTECKEKRKHKRSHRREAASDDDESCDSEIEDRKEAKRRRKEEKKLRKEEKRRRREERRRRKVERHADKHRSKDHNHTNSSEDDHVGRKESHRSDDEERQSEQKRLEIELREKALESLKAKKGVGH